MKVEVTARKVKKGTIIAKCNMTLKNLGEFESMEDFRKEYPSAEITCTEEHDGFTVVYC